jgi:hypothetical protein
VTSQEPAPVGRNGASCHKSNGDPCPNHPMKGSTVCSAHLLGKTARRNAAVRSAVAEFQDGDTPQDPSEVLLRVVHVTWLQSQLHRAKLAQQAAEGRDPYVRIDKTGREYPSAYAVLEQSERRMTADMAAKAVGADLAGRHLRLQERYVDSMEQLIVRIVRHFDGDPDAPEVRAVIHSELLALAGGEAT